MIRLLNRSGSWRSAALSMLWLCTAALAVPPEASAQTPRFRDLPINHPTQCPYCEGDEALMKAAGIVSHGDFQFANLSTEAADKLLSTNDIRWIETAHFEIAFGLGPHKVGQKEKRKIRGELTRMAELLPNVEPKKKILDPWLRAHLYAQRCEDLWEQTLGFFQVKAEDFPDGTKSWDMTGSYMGEGPYLGQKGKFELLYLPSQVAHETFLRDQFGLRIRRTQRYNVVGTDSLIVAIHTQQEGLRVDEALHGHTAFNLAQSFLDAYKHYSYDLPIWLREGFSHWMERSINPKFNSFDGSEGTSGEKTRKDDWRVPTRKLVTGEKAPSLASLMAVRGFGELKLEHHFTTWSMIDFLMTEHPDFFGKLVSGIKGLTNSEGFADGTSLPEVHRDLFKEHFGVSYGGFDRLWRTWVLETY